MEEIQEKQIIKDETGDVLKVVLEETQQTIFDDSDDFFAACQSAENVEIIEEIKIGGGN